MGDTQPLDGDAAGTGEQSFNSGMNRAAEDHDAADGDVDNKLDFAEFCELVRGREEGEHSEEELRVRFELLDVNNSGKIDMHEYLIWSLKDCLARASTRLIDLFKKWDEDHSGHVDKNEFHRAIKALGFPVDRADTDAVFDSIDADHSGTLEYKELNERLRAGLGEEMTKRNLKRAPTQADRSRTGKLSAKNINANYVVAHAAVLPDTVKLDAGSGVPIQEQLRKVLKENHVKLVELFQQWDDDGNGGLDKKEWRRGVAAIGYEAPKADIDAIFDSMDDDGNQFIEFAELKAALHDKRAAPDAGGNKGIKALKHDVAQGSGDFDDDMQKRSAGVVEHDAGAR